MFVEKKCGRFSFPLRDGDAWVNCRPNWKCIPEQRGLQGARQAAPRAGEFRSTLTCSVSAIPLQSVAKSMRRHLLLAVTVAGFLGLAAAWAQRGPTPGPTGGPAQPQQPRQQLPPGTASLSGTVVVMGSGQAIPGASLEMRRADCNTFSNPPEVVTATTDGNGKFEFQNLHAGGWCIVATVPGGAYTPAEYMQRGSLGRGATIPIADGQRVTGIQLSMAPTGGIAGRVRDADGEPMAHARVQVMEPFSEEGQRRLYILQVAQTNDLGEYRFFWLPPGPYYMAVVPENTRARNVVSVQPPPGTGGHREDVIAPVVTPAD